MTVSIISVMRRIFLVAPKCRQAFLNNLVIQAGIESKTGTDPEVSPRISFPNSAVSDLDRICGAAPGGFGYSPGTTKPHAGSKFIVNGRYNLLF